ncbi:MAG: hypothetical protein AAFN12_07770 [Cyanobacteria bacterium J06560_2]
MIPAVENTVGDSLTSCDRSKTQLSVEVKKHESTREVLKEKKASLRPRSLFDYRICISWFGGVQIHPKS